MLIIAEQQTGDSDPDMDEALRRVKKQTVDVAFYRLVQQLVPVLATEDDLNRDLDRHITDDDLDELLGGEQVAGVDAGSMAEESRPCGACHGSGGYTETTFDDDGTRRDTWHSCGACHGSGQG